jgi:hypothetical protein
MLFSELYLIPGSQVSRVQHEDGWGTVFRYTEQQWQLISKEIGDEDRRFVYGEFEYDARSLLELFGHNCLDDGTPDQLRAYHDDREEATRGLGRAFLDFANSLKKLGYDDKSTFTTGEHETTGQFNVGELTSAGEQYSRFAHRMKNMEVLIGSFEPRPRGRVDPARTKYLKRLCQFWDRDLRLKVGSSVTEEGAAAGPMVRFLVVCVNPLFTIRRTGPLTTAGARAAIRSYESARKGKDQKSQEKWKSWRRMAKHLRRQHRVSP